MIFRYHYLHKLIISRYFKYSTFSFNAIDRYSALAAETSGIKMTWIATKIFIAQRNVKIKIV